MKKTITMALAALLMVPTLALGVSLAGSLPAQAEGYTVQEGANAARGQDTPDRLTGEGGIFTTIVNVLLFIVGAIAVIMLIIGGIRYVVSGGDSGNVTAAKNTILYAIVGIVIAVLAYAIVNWVLAALIEGL